MPTFSPYNRLFSTRGAADKEQVSATSRKRAEIWSGVGVSYDTNVTPRACVQLRCGEATSVVTLSGQGQITRDVCTMLTAIMRRSNSPPVSRGVLVSSAMGPALSAMGE